MNAHIPRIGELAIKGKLKARGSSFSFFTNNHHNQSQNKNISRPTRPATPNMPPSDPRNPKPGNDYLNPGTFAHHGSETVTDVDDFPDRSVDLDIYLHPPRPATVECNPTTT
jgi:hypothetical protein